MKKSHYIILGIVALAVVALLQLPVGPMGKLKLAISSVFVSLFTSASFAHESLGHAKEEITPRLDLVGQLDESLRENQALKIQLAQDAQLWDENARLRAEVGWARQRRWPIKLARVIARDPANWWRSIEIDLGSRDGLRTNLAVLTSDGLVGRVQSVGETRSQVILLGDPNLRVSALVTSGLTNRETGIITASSSSPRMDDMIDLDLFAGVSSVAPGQSVETWGAGGVFPAGLHIGRIVDVQTNDYGLSVEARVKLAANLTDLEEVWVLLP